MDEAIQSAVLDNNFSFFPFSRGLYDLLSWLLLLAAIIYFVRKLHEQYKQTGNDIKDVKKKMLWLNVSWGAMIITTIMFLAISFVNVRNVKRSMNTASNLSNIMTLNGEDLVVIPDFPKSQKYLVLDNYKTIAVINETGYHPHSNRGRILADEAEAVYAYRFKLKTYQDQQMFSKSNRIHKEQGKYVVHSWNARGEQIAYVGNPKTMKLKQQRDTQAGLSKISDDDNPYAYHFKQH